MKDFEIAWIDKNSITLDIIIVNRRITTGKNYDIEKYIDNNNLKKNFIICTNYIIFVELSLVTCLSRRNCWAAGLGTSPPSPPEPATAAWTETNGSSNKIIL